MMRAAVVAVALALCGCLPDTTMESGDPTQSRQRIDGERFIVERVEVFRDRIAYNDIRGIYVIKDKRTGREFIGVSGIGIAEMGSHTQSNGKTTYTVEDER